MSRTKGSATTARKDTAASLLAMIHAKYDFGPQTNARIRTVLTTATIPQEVWAPAVDPLTVIPRAFAGIPHTDPRPHMSNTYGIILITLGFFDGYVASIRYSRGTTTFAWGCAREHSEASARTHWRDGRSTASGKRRPCADALIAWAANICRHRGWAW